ncbi:hypothetical protein AZL_014320 [Azospirillum sp. B510]|uniref:lysozyme inhibitor LprI family protein n=1 Tax=Azospirillum sp. (strain B510) TaxID=137722 RepID=UPI0001C4C414|nr:lysozyme inhibitor LprI family protein [Azospirillum sp. B510]BAI72070.1 hypothetical protein AZL_014320 [Azospirillum sp. B510]
MRVLSLAGGLLAAGSLFAIMAAVPALSAPADGSLTNPGPIESTAPDCDAAETPMAQLVCRDPKLAAAGAALDDALAALGTTTDDAGRAAIGDSQTVWRARRDEACPVSAADLADAKSVKTRTDCLMRVIRQRTAALEAERQARSRPVADMPLTVTGAAARQFAAPQQQMAPFNRKVALSTLAGRWGKADPNDRTAIDDCRSSYLEIGADRGVHAVDTRLPPFPLEGTLTADGDPVQGIDLLAAGPVEGTPPRLATLRLLPADSPRFDRLLLRLEPPATFAAEFLRCR